jgi:molecular chaperone DnaK (HSP70)
MQTETVILVSAAVVAVLALRLRSWSAVAGTGATRADLRDRWHALVVEDASPIVGADGLTAEALGVETLGGVFTPLIEEGTKVPCSRSETFSTATDGQSDISVALFRGRDGIASRNHALGRFKIVGIPAAPRGVPMVRVTFAISGGQVLLSARDERSQAEYRVLPESGSAIPRLPDPE